MTTRIKKGTTEGYGSAKTLKSKVIEDNLSLSGSNDRGALFFNYGGEFNAFTGILNNSFFLNESTIAENVFYYVSESGNRTIHKVTSWKKGDIFFLSRGKISIIPLSGMVSEIMDLKLDYEEFKLSVLKTFHNLLVKEVTP